MLRGKEILSTYNERYNQSWEKIQPLQAESLTDIQYYLGKQYTPQELHYLSLNEREAITNNKIRRAVNLVTGEQRLNRLASAVMAVNEFDPLELETADQISEAVHFVLMKRGGYFHISDCFHGSMISAINFSEMYFDYSEDFDDGDIRFLRIPHNAIMWDPYFQNFDLSDCNYLMRRKYISHVTAMGLLPDRAKEIRKLKPEKRDGKFPDIPFENNANGQPLLAYDEFWERDTKAIYHLVHMETNVRFPFKDKTPKKAAKAALDQLNAQAGREVWKLVTKQKPTVNLYVIIEGEVFYSGGEPNGIDDYPFTPFIAYHTPEYCEYDLNMQSFIRAARDPQKELNKRISKALDMMDTRLYGGHYVKLSKLADQDDIYHSGNHGNIGLTDDAVIGQDIAPIQLPDVPASVFQMQNVFDENIMDVLNLNDAAFGTPQKGDQSGYAQMLQQSSAMMGLQPLYDNLNKSQQMITCKLIRMIQQWSDEKIQRITGKPPAAKFRDKDFSKWDAICTQSVLTEHQKKLNFMQLVQLREMGVEGITGTMLAKRAPIQDKSTFLKELEQNEQAAAQQQQQIAQLEAQMQQLQAALVQSQIRENEADTVRQTGRAIADIGLTNAHIAEAEQKRANAALDLTKAANEIQDLRSERFRSAVAFITELQERFRMQHQQELANDKMLIDQTTAQLKTPQAVPQGGASAI